MPSAVLSVLKPVHTRFFQANLKSHVCWQILVTKVAVWFEKSQQLNYLPTM